MVEIYCSNDYAFQDDKHKAAETERKETTALIKCHMNFSRQNGTQRERERWNI